MFMFIDIVWLLVGLALILIGANILTDGSSAIARRMGVSDLIIGLTVVAFGTSAPELAISVISSASGNAQLAIGNVVGSNIFNILVIIGVTAMVRPIVIERSVMTLELPMVILSSLVLLLIGNSGLIDGSGNNEVSRVNGILLLVFFVLFMRYTFASAKRQPEIKTESQATDEGQSSGCMSPAKSIVFIVAGLAALIWGGDRFVSGASGIASALGVSDAVIGLTIVALGTSLPELATSIVAALKGKPGLAVGNVIGSNIFNILMVLGVSATVNPLPFGSIGNFDLLTLVGASFAFLLFGQIIKTRTITRIEGAILAAAYIGYTTVLIINA